MVKLRKEALGRSLPIIVIAASALVGLIWLRDELSFEALAANRDALMAFRDGHYAAALLAFMAVYVAIVALSLPGATLATVTGGFLFGIVPGVFVNVAAATLGACIIFWAARRGVGERIEARLAASRGLVHRLHDGLHRNELTFLLMMRLIPAIPFVLANVVPALLAISLRRFALTTFFGIMPGAAVYTWVGVGLDGVIARGQTPDFGIIFRSEVLGPLLALAALTLAPLLLRQLKPRRDRAVRKGGDDATG